MARFHKPSFLLQMPEIEDAIQQFELEQQIDELIEREKYREWIEDNYLNNYYWHPDNYHVRDSGI